MLNRFSMAAGIVFVLIFTSFCHSTTTFIWIRNDSLAQGREISFTEPQRSVEDDFDNDGDIDKLVKSDYGGWSILININGVFEQDSIRFSDYYKSVKIFDANQDGLDDMVFLNNGYIGYINDSQRDSLRFNHDTNMFLNVTKTDDFEFIDLDDDGDYDLAILADEAIITYENKSTDDSKNKVLKWDAQRNLPNPFGSSGSVVCFEMLKSDSVYIQVLDHNFKEFSTNFVGYLEEGIQNYWWTKPLLDEGIPPPQGNIYCRLYTKNEQIIIPKWYAP